MRINLGSGSKLLEGFINVDCYHPDAEVKHDLDVRPWPFATESVSEVIMDNSLEHLTDVIAVMKELHRVTMPGGIITITVPYFRSVWAHLDPTHKHFFTVDTLSYFDVDHKYYQRYKFALDAKFRIIERKFNKNIDKSWFRRLVLPLANKYPNAYETYFSHLYPMEDLTIVLERI